MEFDRFRPILEISFVSVIPSCFYKNNQMVQLFSPNCAVLVQKTLQLASFLHSVLDVSCRIHVGRLNNFLPDLHLFNPLVFIDGPFHFMDEYPAIAWMQHLLGTIKKNLIFWKAYIFL